MDQDNQQKFVRSYRLVFRRRWRIFRIQGWRVPLPGGLELRLLGYWITCLLSAIIASRLPLLGALLCLAPASLRLLALPLAGAWALSRWEVDGRPPHRALAGLIAWRLRPRSLAGLRRCPPPGTELAPLDRLLLGPDLSASSYPRGRLRGPARLLLRFPLRVESRPRNRWYLRGFAAPPLHRGKTVTVPPGRTLVFEPPP